MASFPFFDEKGLRCVSCVDFCVSRLSFFWFRTRVCVCLCAWGVRTCVAPSWSRLSHGLVFARLCAARMVTALGHRRYVFVAGRPCTELNLCSGVQDPLWPILGDAQLFIELFWGRGQPYDQTELHHDDYSSTPYTEYVLFRALKKSLSPSLLRSDHTDPSMVERLRRSALNHPSQQVTLPLLCFLGCGPLVGYKNWSLNSHPNFLLRHVSSLNCAIM